VLATSRDDRRVDRAAALVATMPTVPELAFAALVAGEALERVLFFRAISPARMPGSV
jgi:hypothetical protein